MDTAARKVVWSESQDDNKFHSLAFRADGRVLAVGGWDGQIRLVDPKAGRVTHQYAVAESVVWHLAFSPDGTDLVAGVDTDGKSDVVRFEATSGKARWTFRTESAHDLFFTADGKAVVYYGPARKRDDPYQWHWLDATTGKPLGRTMDTGWYEAALRPDGKVMAIGGFHGHVAQWDLTTRKRMDGASADPGVPVSEFGFTAGATRVRGWANGWYEWDVKTGKQTRVSPPLDFETSESVVGSPDSKWEVRGRGLFHLSEFGQRDRRPIGIDGDTFRFLADGRLVRNQQDRLAVYLPPEVDPRVRVKAEGGTVAASADGTTAVGVLPVGDHLHASRWDLADGKKVGEWDGRLPDPSMIGRSHAWRAQLSPDGRVLAVFFSYLAFQGMGFNDIYEMHTALFDARTGRYLSGWYDLHTQADLAFSPDGRTVACFYGGLGVDVREVATGGRRARRSNPPITAATFSPDGRTLALATSPGPVALWDWFGKPAGKWADEKPAKRWDVLANGKAEEAFDAIRLLQAHPKEAVAFLKERMKVPTVPAADWVTAGIKALDAASFREREQASSDLAAAGEAVLPALRAALKGSSAEARRRLEALLEQPAAPSPEKIRTVRSCEVLEGIATPEARDLLAAWAKGAPGAMLTREAGDSLERLKRG
jgi:WD40 repeat protein